MVTRSEPTMCGWSIAVQLIAANDPHAAAPSGKSLWRGPPSLSDNASLSTVAIPSTVGALRPGRGSPSEKAEIPCR